MSDFEQFKENLNTAINNVIEEGLFEDYDARVLHDLLATVEEDDIKEEQN